jgi:hypothetical protein
MSWINNEEFSFIYKQFDYTNRHNYPRGDQEYISNILAINKKRPVFFQDVVDGIYSHKRNCRNSLPTDARVICFHGRPRPYDVKEEWVKDNWR